MTHCPSAKSEPAIAQELVDEAHDASRWAWFRDHCTRDQMEVLCTVSEGCTSRRERQQKLDAVLDAFIAKTIMHSAPEKKPAAAEADTRTSTARGWSMEMNGTTFAWQPDAAPARPS